MEQNSPHPDPRKIFEPEETKELFRGWQLHLHKGRDRHDRAARRYDRIRIWLGAVATVFSAIVGTSVFTVLEKGSSCLGTHAVAIKAAVECTSILAAILTGLNAFLNLSERTEKHRSAGAQYKALIWELERIGAPPVRGLTGADPAVVRIQEQMRELERSAPVVPERIYDRVENEWNRRGVDFVAQAKELIG